MVRSTWFVVRSTYDIYNPRFGVGRNLSDSHLGPSLKTNRTGSRRTSQNLFYPLPFTWDPSKKRKRVHVVCSSWYVVRSLCYNLLKSFLENSKQYVNIDFLPFLNSNYVSPSSFPFHYRFFGRSLIRIREYRFVNFLGGV